MANKNQKLEEAIVYVARCNLANHLFGKIKLNKILYYSDVNAYLRLGVSITGTDYEKREFGPVPRNMAEIVSRMESEGTVHIYDRTMPDFRVQERVTPLRDADLSAFKPQEIAILHEVMAWIGPMTATEVSDLSHESVGWEAARMGESIPYATALVERRMTALNEEEIAFAASLAEKLATRQPPVHA